jgi:hypothetical protein
MTRTGFAVLLAAAVCCTRLAHAVTVTLADGTMVSLQDPTVAATDDPLSLTGANQQQGPVITSYAIYSGYFNGGSSPGIGVSYYDQPSSVCGGFCGGGVVLTATYQFVYSGLTPASATIMTGDVLSTNTALAYGNAALLITGGSTTLTAQEDCLNATQCENGLGGATIGPLVNASVTLTPDVVYTVEMIAAVLPSALGFYASAEVDPEIVLSGGSGGQIYYSDGISQADMPEPGSLVLLATGGAALLLRRRSRV